MSPADSGRRHPSRWLTLAGLAAIVGLLLYPVPTTWTVVISAPLVVLLAFGLRPPPKWGGWVAAIIIPYFAGTLGEALASPNASTPYWALTVLTIITFLAALYYVRSTGVSLRR